MDHLLYGYIPILLDLGGGYVTRIRHIIVSVFAIIYLAMFFMKVEIPRTIFIILLGTILISQVIDDWSMYKKTKKKRYLIIPITFLIIIIVGILIKLFGS